MNSFRSRRFSRRSTLGLLTAAITSRMVRAASATPPSKSDAPPRIRAAQIGTQHSHASGKLASIRQLDQLYDVVAVVEPDRDQRERVMQKQPYSGLPFIDEATLLNDQSVSVVLVETELEQLVPTAIRCLQAGKHVHVDKPAGLSLSACREMHREAQQRGLTVQMGYMLRYNPAFTRLFEILDMGWLGTVREINAGMGKWADQPLRDDLARYAGGGMYELACHLIDAVITIMGPPQQISGYHRQSRLPHDTFADNQLAVFPYPEAIATVRCNHLDPLGGSRRFFEVVGDQGTYRIEPLEPAVAKLGLARPHGGLAAGWHDLTFPAPSGRYDDEFRDLAVAVRGEKPLRWNAEHDIAVHQAVLAASGMPEEPY